MLAVLGLGFRGLGFRVPSGVFAGAKQPSKKRKPISEPAVPSGLAVHM